MQPQPQSTPSQAPTPSQPDHSRQQSDQHETTGEASSPSEGSKLSDLDISKKFNFLTAQEKKLREREMSMKSEKEKLDAISEQLANLKQNPLKALEAAGWTFKDLAELILNDEQPTTEKKIASLEQQIIEDKRAREEERKAQAEEERLARERELNERYNSTIEKAKSDIHALVDGSDDFELIKSQGAHDLVWDVVQEVFNETKQVIDFREAATRVEEHLTEEVEKLLKVNKFQQRYKPVAPKDEGEELGHNYYMKKILEEKFGRSLSNDMVSEGSRTPSEEPYLSDDESKARLAKKLRDMLGRQ